MEAATKPVGRFNFGKPTHAPEGAAKPAPKAASQKGPINFDKVNESLARKLTPNLCTA
jgi:hypothetical protein